MSAFFMLRYSDEEINNLGQKIVEDHKNDLYTLFDYLANASRLPSAILVELTNLSEIERRQFVRGVCLPPTSGRIWKKCKIL